MTAKLSARTNATNETRNPLDVRRTPGGSSSGSGAAVGAGMVPVGLGTQTQGSTLRPASYCGVVGFKPSHGALPMQGVHPISFTHDHLGVIGGTLQDTWLTASHISVAGGQPGSPGLHGHPAQCIQGFRFSFMTRNGIHTSFNGSNGIRLGLTLDSI